MKEKSEEGGGFATAAAVRRSRPSFEAFVPFRDRLLHRALRRALEGCGSVLDVGCGPASPLQKAGYRGLAIGLDLSAHELGRAKRAGFHAGLVRADVATLESVVRPASVDAVVALDLIEHLHRDRAFRLLDALERTARRKVVVITPNGFVPQPGTAENPFQEHLSGFSVADMRARGYRVRGILGPWFLFGPFGDVRLRPGVLWRRIADLTAPVVSPLPRVAFALLCTKEVAPPR
jgi:SAM-dependent methyltransferase